MLLNKWSDSSIHVRLPLLNRMELSCCKSFLEQESCSEFILSFSLCLEEGCGKIQAGKLSLAFEIYTINLMIKI